MNRSTVEEFLEIECADGVAKIAHRLVATLLDQCEFDETPYSEDSKPVLDWIFKQNEDTMKSLLQWIVKECI